MWRLVVSLALLGLALAEDDVFECYSKKDSVLVDREKGISMNKGDRGTCSKTACYMTEYQRGATTYRDFGCFDGGNACPVVNTRKKRDTGKKSCYAGVQYSTETVSEGHHVLACASNYNNGDASNSWYSLNAYCYNGILWSEEQYNKKSADTEISRCSKTTNRWRNNWKPNNWEGIKIMIGTTQITTNYDYSVGEVVRFSCLDDYHPEISGTWSQWTSPDFAVTVTEGTSTNVAASFNIANGDKWSDTWVKCTKTSNRWSPSTSLGANTVGVDAAGVAMATGTYQVGTTMTVTCKNKQYQISGTVMTAAIMKVKVVEGATAADNAKWVNQVGDVAININQLTCSLKAIYDNTWESLETYSGAFVKTITVTSNDGLLPGYMQGQDLSFTCMDNYRKRDNVVYDYTFSAGGGNAYYHVAGSTSSFNGWSSIYCVFDTQNIIVYTDVLLTNKNQKLVQGAADFPSGMIKSTTTGLKIACMDGYVKPTNSEWTDDQVALTFAAAGTVSGQATLKSGTLSYANFRSCIKPSCATSDLTKYGFDVYNGISTSIKYTAAAVSHGDKLFVSCNNKDYKRQDVNGANLRAYECGSVRDRDWGDMFYACTEYKNCTTLVSCSKTTDGTLCNGSATIVPTLALLAALLAAALFRQ